jgi:hypothetical protein
MCTAPVDFARLAGRSTRGTAPGMGGDLQEQWGVRGDPPQAGHGGGEVWEKKPLGKTWGCGSRGSGKVPLKVPLIPGPKLRLISSTPLEPPFVLSSDILKIRTLVQGTNTFFYFYHIY